MILLASAPLFDEIPEVALDAFGFFDDLLQTLLLLARLLNPVPCDREDTSPRRLLGAPVGVRFVPAALSFPEQHDKQGILRDSLKGGRDLIFSSRGGIILQAPTEDVGHVRLRRQ